MDFERDALAPVTAGDIVPPSLEAVEEIIGLAAVTLDDFDLSTVSPDEAGRLRNLAAQVTAMSSAFSTRVSAFTSAILHSPQYEPRAFNSLDAAIITSRLLRADEVPRVLLDPDEEPLAITVVGERQVAANGLSYVFEDSEDNALLGMFDALFACRNQFPEPRTLRDAPWLRGVDVALESRRLKYLVNALCRPSFDAPEPVYLTSIGSLGMRLRMMDTVMLIHEAHDIVPLRSGGQNALDGYMQRSRQRRRK